MTEQEIDTMKYKVCCPMCDNDKCVKGTGKCEAEKWKRSRNNETDSNSALNRTNRNSVSSSFYFTRYF